MKKNNLYNFNFEKIGEEYFISNDFGNYLWLKSGEFKKMITGKLSIKSEAFLKLKKGGFFKDCLDFDGLTERMNDLMPVSYRGPSLHILVVTLKCNHNCVYCRAVGHRDDFFNTDMSFETAKKSVDMAFSSPNRQISLEFQGGEALINWPIVKKTVKYAKRLNKESGRDLVISLVTNLSLMDDDKFKFLTDENISVCSSLDGPGFIHNKNRVFVNNSSHRLTVKWLKKFLKNSDNRKHDKDSLPSALMTTTKHSLKYPKEIVDEYYNMGFGGIFLRPLSPIGYAKEAWGEIGYSPKDYMEFYEKALDYILKLNGKKKKFIERTAAIILRKILKKEEPNYLDMRSPCGATLGQMAYNYNGDVYTCDEGRMVGAKGDDSFKIGNVYKNKYEELINSNASKLCVISSCLENQIKCSRCVFKPFCGICPVHNYETQMSPWGNMSDSGWCETQKGLFKIIIRKLQNARKRKIFESWFE